MKKILFISGLRFGDSLHILPIVSWLHKQRDVRIDWMYHSQVEYIHALVDLVREHAKHEPGINAMRSFNFWEISQWSGKEINPSWRPYITLTDYAHKFYKGFYDEIYCFAYSKEDFEAQTINFFSDHFAQEHGLGVDYDFKLKIGEPDFKFADYPVKIDKMYAPIMQDIPAIELSDKNGIVENMRLCAGAKAVLTTRTGSAVALSLARIPFYIKFVDNDYDFFIKTFHVMTGGITRL